MNITISLGWWLLPLSVTCLAFFFASYWTEPNQRGLGASLDALVFNALALIISLIAWLIWAVLT